jgi:hypothetical protein
MEVIDDLSGLNQKRRREILTVKILLNQII